MAIDLSGADLSSARRSINALHLRLHSGSAPPPVDQETVAALYKLLAQPTMADWLQAGRVGFHVLALLLRSNQLELADELYLLLKTYNHPPEG